MPSLAARVLDIVLPTALAFWRWWVGELAALMPAQISTYVGPTASAEVRPYRDRVEIVRLGKTEGERLIEPVAIDRFGDEHWAEVVGLVADRRAQVVLTPPLVHVVHLTLPKAARSRLSSAVPLQLRDHAPLRPELLDWALLDVEPNDDQRLRLRVVIARRTLLDAIANGFEGKECPAPRIVAEIGTSTCLLRERRKAGALLELSSPWTIAAAILVATPFLALMLLSILCMIENDRVAELDQVVRPKLAAEQRLIQKAAIGRSLRTIAELPTVTAIVEDLAARLPQTASARQIAANSDAVRITLDVADPTPIAKLLEHDPVLPELRQIGDPRKAGDRYQIDYAAPTP